VQPAREAVEAYRRAAAASGADVTTLTAIAQQLLGLSHWLGGRGLYAEAVAAAQAAVEELRTIRPAPGAEAAHSRLLGDALHILVVWLILAGRIGDAVQPAREAVEAYRRAAAASGADAGALTAIAQQLLGLSHWLGGREQYAEAVAAAQAAVDVLHGFEPAPGTEAAHSRLLGDALHILVVWLILAGRIGDAVQPAREAVEAYRQAAAAPDADRFAIAQQLLGLSHWLGGRGLYAEAVAAAQAAVDVLRMIEPAPGTEAAHSRLLADTLHTLVIWLILAGPVDNAVQPARETVEAYRQAAAAPDADRLAIAQQLKLLSQWLGGAGLQVEAAAAAQAAEDVLGGFGPPTDKRVEDLTLFAEALAAGRVDEARVPAREAVQVYQQAVPASGADVAALTATTQHLLGLPGEVSIAWLRAEAAAAAQAAEDVLGVIEPPPDEGVEY
jgi:tetratricopeptide (TPR) repeat protein